MNPVSILQKIIHTKHQEVAHLKASTDLMALERLADAYHPKGFAKALMAKNPAVIAEIKKASPSKGIIAEHFDPVASAIGYQQAGAACLSVLTDQAYFLGSDDYLKQVRQAVDLPILRKDFMIDEVQILAAKAMGADCILLIVACLDTQSLTRLHAYAISLGLDVLIETHDEAEVRTALSLPYSTHNIYGINNRNLNTFETSLDTSIALANHFRKALGDDVLLVSESGIHQPQDIHLLQSHGLNKYLIGEQFMKSNDAGAALKALLDSI